MAMKYSQVILFVVMCAVLCESRHIHPGVQNEIIFEDLNKVETDQMIDVIRNVKPSRFVPINSVLFFKTYEPCEEGFKRDALGICREVWD